MIMIEFQMKFSSRGNNLPARNEEKKLSQEQPNNRMKYPSEPSLWEVEVANSIPRNRKKGIRIALQQYIELDTVVPSALLGYPRRLIQVSQMENWDIKTTPSNPSLTYRALTSSPKSTQQSSQRRKQL
jgi:hypothetical protein